MKASTITKWNDIDMAELELSKLIEHFAYTKKAEGKSAITVAWYQEQLKHFSGYLTSTGRQSVLGVFSVDIVREYIVQQQDRGLSTYTVMARIRALKAFSTWLHEENYTADNLLVKVKLPKPPVRVVETLTPEDIDKLIGSQNPLTAVGSRNIALLLTLLDTGIRCGELTSLKLEDAHIEEGFLKVFGKGARERLVPLGSTAQKAIWRYLFHFRPEPLNSSHDHLLLNLKGKRLTNNAIKLILHRWGHAAGVPRLHAHLCRHTYATNYLVHDCGDVFRLQHILGHSTLEMVRRYVHHASVQEMLQSRSSPLDRMGLKKLNGYKLDKTLKLKR